MDTENLKVYEYQEPDNNQNFTIDDLNGKTVVSMANGEKLGSVYDVLVDPESLKIAALIVSRGGVFQQKQALVPAPEINAWGKDAVLIKGEPSLLSEEEVADRKNWVRASNQIQGRPLVSAGGEKLGTIHNIVVNENGQIVAYQVSGGTFSSDKRVNAQMTQTLGGDVVIVRNP